MKETIKLVNKQRDVLVDVIQWLDEKNFSNTEIREKVDHILNHSRKLHEESDMELTKIKVLEEMLAAAEAADGTLSVMDARKIIEEQDDNQK